MTSKKIDFVPPPKYYQVMARFGDVVSFSSFNYLHLDDAGKSVSDKMRSNLIYNVIWVGYYSGDDVIDLVFLGESSNPHFFLGSLFSWFFDPPF